MLGYIFEWEGKKADSNARKHGVTFDEACTAFRDPLARLMPDLLSARRATRRERRRFEEEG